MLDPEVLYQMSLPSPQSRKTYGKLLQQFNAYLGKDKTPMEMSEDVIISYLLKMQEKGLAYSTRATTLSAIKHFYEINEVQLKWKKIGRFLGERTRHEDRPYTREEIQQILTKCDERKRVIILLMASTGIRSGAFSTLKLKHLKKMGDVYQLTIYDGSPEKYRTFCSQECASAIDSYLDYRRRWGEKVTPDSPLVREQFNKTTHSKPRMLTTAAIRRLVWQLCLDSGVREKPTEETAYKRKDVQLDHGFRKFFATSFNQATKNPLYVELLLGHDTGLAGVYTKPSDADLLEFYEGGMDAVTINEEFRLKHQLTEERERNDAILARLDSIEKELGH